jgi:RNA polymerase sigma-70 factor (ECF subfamily)
MKHPRYTNDQADGSKPDASPNLDSAELEQFRERLRYFAARRLRSWTEAEDVAQEALRRAFEALNSGRISNPSALPAFLFQTALHVCQHRARSFGREARALREVGAVKSGQTTADDPLASLISEERRVQVRAALERLESNDREVLSLTYVEALQTAQIAQRLDLTEGNVRVRRHRALQRLAEILGVTTRTDRGLKR